MEKQEIKSVLKKYTDKGIKLVSFVVVFILGYFSSEIYHKVKSSEIVAEKSSPKVTKKIDKVSVAINERNELMIIDRTDGTYEIYQDSVGMCVFNLYANSIQSKYRNP
jgi:hypothetical protein